MKPCPLLGVPVARPHWVTSWRSLARLIPSGWADRRIRRPLQIPLRECSLLAVPSYFDAQRDQLSEQPTFAFHQQAVSVLLPQPVAGRLIPEEFCPTGSDHKRHLLKLRAIIKHADRVWSVAQEVPVELREKPAVSTASVWATDARGQRLRWAVVGGERQYARIAFPPGDKSAPADKGIRSGDFESGIEKSGERYNQCEYNECPAKHGSLLWPQPLSDHYLVRLCAPTSFPHERTAVKSRKYAILKITSGTITSLSIIATTPLDGT